MTNQETAVKMRQHHASMVAQLSALNHRLQSQNGQAEKMAQTRDAIVEFAISELLPHAAAEESTIYRAAQNVDGFLVFVRSMIDEHQVLREIIDSLKSATTDATMVSFAGALDSLFTWHAEKENRFIIDDFAKRDTIDLSTILGAMHQKLS